MLRLDNRRWIGRYQVCRQCREKVRLEMKLFDWLEMPEGKVRFAGGLRGPDEWGVEAFAVKLPGSVECFGAFDSQFDDPSIRVASVLITLFGYPDQYNIGNKHPRARLSFDADQVGDIMKLIDVLFTKSTELPAPFFDIIKFDGKIIFEPGWISEI